MATVERLCANPSCQNIGKHLCKGCGEELYCSKECQKTHWPAHKLACKTAVKPESTPFMRSFDELSIKQLKNVMKAKASTMDAKKRTAILDRLETLIEKPSLVRLVKEHVALAEVEMLLSSPIGTATAAPAPPTSSSRKRGQVQQQQQQQPTFTKASGTPTPAQMREQAAFIRKNPDLLRRAQPAFANLTDEQVRQYADQLEQAANDPAMLKEVERMSKMTDSERTLLQSIQEGVAGVKPIDGEWIDKVVKAFKKKPSTFKTLLAGRGAMLGGVSDEQIGSFIDMLAGMSEFTLRIIAYGIWYMASMVKPISAAYKFIDDYTFGSARYIALLLFGIVMYYLSYFLFIVGRFFFVRIYAVAGLVYGKIYPAAPVIETATGLAAKAAAGLAGGAAVAEMAAKGLSADASAAVGGASAAAGMAAQGAAKAVAEDAEFDF